MKPKCQGNLLNFDVYFYAADVACLPALHVSIIYRCTKSALAQGGSCLQVVTRCGRLVIRIDDDKYPTVK